MKPITSPNQTADIVAVKDIDPVHTTSGQAELQKLLNPEPAANLQLMVPPVSSTEASAMAESKPLALAAVDQSHPRKLRRRGRVAALPRLYRDMVNRMLWNGVP